MAVYVAELTKKEQKKMEQQHKLSQRTAGALATMDALLFKWPVKQVIIIL